MASRGVSGKTEEEIEEMRVEYQDSRRCQKHDIPFDTAYCLCEIPRQPDDYDGPQRYCSRGGMKLSREEWEERYDDTYRKFDTRSYYPTCKHHGSANIGGTPENLEDPRTVNITHGLRSQDEHLQMDFDESEQTLYDAVTEQWPEMYDWPPEDEDPARYEMLDMAATNFVRRRRAEDYIDEEGEVRISDRYNDEGVVVEPDGLHEENPIANEYRLLIHEITNLLKELGLTPKERASLGAEQKSADALSEIGDAVNTAILGDSEYDPDQFDETNETNDSELQS